MKINPLLALCALPALVQPAVAESKLENAETLIAEGIQTAQSYAEVIDMIVEKKSTPADGAKLIKELSANLQNIQESLMKLIGELSPEEQAELQKMLADPEMVEAMKAIDGALNELKTQLIKARYFDSIELKAACEEYDATYAK